MVYLQNYFNCSTLVDRYTQLWLVTAESYTLLNIWQHDTLLTILIIIHILKAFNLYFPAEDSSSSWLYVQTLHSSWWGKCHAIWNCRFQRFQTNAKQFHRYQIPKVNSWPRWHEYQYPPHGNSDFKHPLNINFLLYIHTLISGFSFHFLCISQVRWTNFELHVTFVVRHSFFLFDH
jgi:hypothetical protein